MSQKRLIARKLIVQLAHKLSRLKLRVQKHLISKMKENFSQKSQIRVILIL